MLAKAKTGTGKTLSFLLPVIEGVIRTPRAQRRYISALIISPTRELAQQITEEARRVLVRPEARGRVWQRELVLLPCLAGKRVVPWEWKPREFRFAGREARGAFTTSPLERRATLLVHLSRFVLLPRMGKGGREGGRAGESLPSSWLIRFLPPSCFG